MVYDLSTAFDAKPSQVLKFTTEYDVFAQYMGFKPIVGKLYNSPLRKDFNASFGLFYSRNGHLLFKDFGSGESGNCFKFASLRDGCSLQHIYNDLYKQYSHKRVRKTPPAEIPKIISESTDIVAEKKPWTEKGLQFWSEFGISQKTLDYYNVSEVTKCWVNGRVYGYSTEKNPIFNYEVFDKNKLYRPHDKKRRFYSNCTSIDIQGWEQLDYNKDTVIITKSLKDVMLLHELGFTAIAPNGEGHKIPDKAIAELRKNFKHIIVWYDKDPSGVNGARRIIRQYPDFGFAFTPSRTEKDITDFYKTHGKESTLKLISKKINHVKKQKERD